MGQKKENDGDLDPKKATQIKTIKSSYNRKISTKSKQ